MTQALVSNISKVAETVSSVENTIPEAGDSLNFGSILDKQISTDNTQPEGLSNDSVSNDKKNSLPKAVQTVLAGSAEVFASVIEETLSEIGAEEAVDLSLAQEEITTGENLSVLDEYSGDVMQDDTITNEDTETVTEEEITYAEKTITTEEQIMNSKLLQNLENSTMTAMMQTQTLSAVSVNRTDDSLNSSQQLNSSLNQKIIDNDDIDVQDKKVNTSQKLEEILNEDMISDLNIESVSADTGSESGDIMNNQTPQEQGVKAILQPEMKYEEVKVKISSGNNIEEMNTEKIIEQISKQLEGMKGNLSKLNMVLNPNSLGKIILQIINSKDGLSAQLSVTSQEARALLMNGLGELRDCMLAQGISVDSVSVKLIDNEEGEYKQDLTEQEGSRGGNKQQGSNKKQEDEKQFEQMMFELNNNGNV